MGRLILKHSRCLFFLVFAIVFICLSYWQYSRLQYKNNLIESLSENSKSFSAGNVSDFSNLYKKIFLKGKFTDKHLFLYAANQNKNTYEVLYLFKSNNNKNYLVNLGVMDTPNIKRYLSQKNISFEGHIIKQSDKKTPLIDNDKKNNIWFYLDYKDIKEIFKVDNLEPIVILPIDSKVFIGKEISLKDKVNIFNNHLQYSITWLCLCIVSLVIALISYKKERQIK